MLGQRLGCENASGFGSALDGAEAGRGDWSRLAGSLLVRERESGLWGSPKKQRCCFGGEGVGCLYTSATTRSGIVAGSLTCDSQLDRATFASLPRTYLTSTPAWGALRRSNGRGAGASHDDQDGAALDRFLASMV